jgi:hypothetical protein
MYFIKIPYDKLELALAIYSAEDRINKINKEKFGKDVNEIMSCFNDKKEMNRLVSDFNGISIDTLINSINYDKLISEFSDTKIVSLLEYLENQEFSKKEAYAIIAGIFGSLE